MTDTPLPEPYTANIIRQLKNVAYCALKDGWNSDNLAALAGAGIFRLSSALSAERQAREAAEAEARSNQLHAEHEHNEGKRLSLMLKEAEARLKEAEAHLRRLIEVYKDMEDGDGEPCPDIRAAAAWIAKGETDGN